MFDFKKKQKEENVEHLNIYVKRLDDETVNFRMEGECTDKMVFLTIKDICQSFLAKTDLSLSDFIALLTFNLIK